jgi:hypothetical protein
LTPLCLVFVFGAFTPSNVDDAFVVNAKGYSLCQDNASDVTGGLVINSKVDWGKSGYVPCAWESCKPGEVTASMSTSNVCSLGAGK